jgi:quercetin dioxygenase-like cupin family protein
MNSHDRLREHPEDRFASPTQFLDLAAAATALRTEPHAAVAGHRQVTVARHGPVTVILFAFEPNGLLKEHHADGEVLLQVLRGRLQVTADEDRHTLGPGTLLVLAPGVPHSVRALEAADMLLTVHRLPIDSRAA